MKRKFLVFLGIVAALAVLAVAFQPRLPDNSEREVPRVMTDGESTKLGEAFKTQLQDHPGESGVRLLGNGLDAFVERVVLARLAEQTIDVQYYMFHQDTVGRLLIKELLAAADRGVHVRMLIDDMYGGEADDVWSALDTHPDIEVRLFNPFVRGRSKNFQFLTRFTTVNYRMHSKTYTADNQATVVGGRNIGDEYFDADPNLAFADMDVVAIGPVAPAVSDEFAQYWNSEHAYPIATLLAEAESGTLGNLRVDLDAHYEQNTTSVYVDALKSSNLANALLNRTAGFNFAEAAVIHDSPEKLSRGEDWREELLISQLAPHIQQATEDFILISPYFVPGQRGADALCELSGKGVEVRVLTNSLASNDVAAVHTGYSRHRKQLLRCGVQLYELNEQIKNHEGNWFTWLPGLSKSSLHAKTMVIDHTAMFVGSFNFDQRSLHINNEIGILFHEPEVAGRSAEKFDQHVAQVAFRVELVSGSDGKESLRWIGNENGNEVVFEDEPYVGFWKRLGVKLMRVLPIDSML